MTEEMTENLTEFSADLTADGQTICVCFCILNPLCCEGAY